MTGQQRRAADALIRHAAHGDLDAVEALENAVFSGDRLSRRSLRYYIGAPTAAFLILERDHAVVGDAIVGFRRDSTMARLYSIAVHPSVAGHGFGICLLDHCEGKALARGVERLRLEVRIDNAAAVRLYERAGYMTFGRYDDYYEDGAAALRFEKRLRTRE